jgi:hypothetical protein
MALTPPGQENIQQVAEALKAGQSAAAAQAANQQEANQAFKESINLLTKINKLIDQSASKTASFEKGAINIKKIESERERIESKRENLLREINRYGAADVTSAKNYIAKVKEREDLEKRLSRTHGIQRLTIQQQLNALGQTIQTEENRLANSKEQLELVSKISSEEGLKERIELLGEELETEKELSKQVGLTANALKIVGKILPAAKEKYSQIVSEVREGEHRTKNLVKASAVFLGTVTLIWKGFKNFVDIANQGLRALTGSGGPVSNFVSPFTNLIKQLPVIGGLIGGLIDAFVNIVDFAMGANSETQKFARNLGISYDYAKALTDQFDEFARNSGQAFITVEKLRKSQTELSSALGINNVFSQEILAADSQLNEQLGLELETRKQLATVTEITGQLQTKIFANLAAQTKLLAANLGVNIRIQDSIKKAASFGGVLGLTFAKYPEKLTKSLLITKALGLDLEKLNGLASGLLDFETSIANEFEAQLLTGKNINLMRARELALNNKLEELAVEINKQFGSSEEFLLSNRLTQDSWSQAVGMTRDEIADMLKQQELFAAAGAKTQKQFKENIILMQQRGTLQTEFLDKLKEEDAQLFLNSTATERIASFLDKIKQSFANLLNNPQFKSFIDAVMVKLSDPNFINNIINQISGFVSILLKAVAAVVDGVDYAVRTLTFGFGDISNEIPNQIRKYANDIGSVSLSTNVLRGQSSSNTQGSNPSVANSGPTTFVINNEIKDAKIVDGPVAHQNRLTNQISWDRQSGKMAPGP